MLHSTFWLAAAIAVAAATKEAGRKPPTRASANITRTTADCRRRLCACGWRSAPFPTEYRQNSWQRRCPITLSTAVCGCLRYMRTGLTSVASFLAATRRPAGAWSHRKRDRCFPQRRGTAPSIAGTSRAVTMVRRSGPLQNDQVQRRRFPDSRDRQPGAYLSAMMGLMVEEVRQRRTQALMKRLPAGVLIRQDPIIRR